MLDSIGPYQLIEQIGEGGMGVVYRAEQRTPVKRTVALKVLKAGLETKTLIARFEAEQQALAMMDHEGIAKVFDAGETEKGQPYFVMELVQGLPIDQYCDERQLNRAARLRLFIRVCEGVQHAHQKGIIHRDLKPSNILVSQNSTPKIIDFGIAKALQGHGPLTDKTLLTNFNQVLGTPAYMSPEQLDLTGYSVDTRTDIYALGVILYELLTGKLPFERERLNKASAAELERILIEEDPPKPSRHQSDLEGDLDWIVMKALEKDHNKRYANADAFAEDITAFLNDAPVSATPPSRAYLTTKFIRRHRTGLAIAGLATVLLVTATAISTWQAMLAKRAKVAEAKKSKQAEERLEESNAMLDFIMSDMMNQAMPEFQKDRDLKLIAAIDHGSQRVNEKFGDQPRIRAFMHSKLSLIYGNLSEFEKAERHLGDAEKTLAEAKALGALDEREFAELQLSLTAQRGAFATGQAKDQEALEYFKSCLSQAESLFGAQSTQAMEYRISIARAYQHLGPSHYREAIPHDEQVRDFWASLPNIAEIPIAGRVNLLTNLGFMYTEEGREQDALEHLQEAERLASKSLGDAADYIHGSMMTNVALGYYHLGQYEKALALLIDLEAGTKKLLGTKHHDYISCLNSLGGTYAKLERWEEAYAPSKAAWEGQREIAGPGAEWTLIYFRNYIDCLSHLNRDEEFETALEQFIHDAHHGMGDGNYLTKWGINGYQRYWRNHPERLAALFPMLTGEEAWPKEDTSILVPKGSAWHYHGGSEPATSWTSTSFDHASWSVGPGPLGYGESDIATEVPFGPNPEAKWAATYFRHPFAYDPSKPLKKLRVKIRRDDGCAVFLNGQLLFKHHLHEDQPAKWNTYATSEVGGIEEELYYSVEIDPMKLQANNVIAAQVHQCNGNSSDVSFDLSLEALVDVVAGETPDTR